MVWLQTVRGSAGSAAIGARVFGSVGMLRGFGQCAVRRMSMNRSVLSVCHPLMRPSNLWASVAATAVRRGPIMGQSPAGLTTTSCMLARARPAPSGRGRKSQSDVEPIGKSDQSPYARTSDNKEDNSLDARLDRSQLATLDDVKTQRYVAKVFREAGSTVGVTTAATVGAMATGLMVSPWIPMIGGLIPLFMFYQTSPATHSTGYRYGLVGTFAGLQGLAMAPLLSLVASANPMLIPAALGGTALIFAGASAASLLAPRASMLRFGTFLGGGAAVLVGFSLLGLGQLALMGTVSPILYNFTLYGGLALMTAFVSYDTHRIIEEHKEGNEDPLRHGLDVFINFVGIFRRLLIILYSREE